MERLTVRTVREKWDVIRMLSAPEAGWTDFQLGGKETLFSLGYLTDVSIEWLDQAIHGLKSMDTFSVHGHCEPGRVICTVSYWNCYLLFEGEDRDGTCEKMFQVHISMIDFCKALYADINDNLEAWVLWDRGSLLSSLDDESDEEAFKKVAERRRQHIQKRLAKLKELIAKREACFEKYKFF